MSAPAPHFPSSLSGSCQCGRVRFVATGQPVNAGWCHCTICRRTSGAVALVWVTVPQAGFVCEGEPAVYRSSAAAERWFCPTCGAQAVFKRDQADTLDLNVGLLDAPDAVAPTAHGCFATHVRWFDPDDGLPRFDGDTWGEPPA